MKYKPICSKEEFDEFIIKLNIWIFYQMHWMLMMETKVTDGIRIDLNLSALRIYTKCKH